MTTPKANHSEYTDKRTGIVYTNVFATATDEKRERTTQQSHLDAFLPAAFLKTYFDGKSKI
jgi:hypothetical protein